MDTREELFYQFLGEIVESYRHGILQRDDAKELVERQKGLSVKVRAELSLLHPNAYALVDDWIRYIHALSSIQQEQLYIQGIKDGIRFKSRIGKIEDSNMFHPL